MPYLTKNNKNILFIRVPRNGSASLSVSFERNGWEHVCRPNSNADIKHRLVIKYASFSEHIHKIKKNNLSINDIQYIFTVLRDPVERVESFFRMMIGRGPNRETSKNPGSYKGGFTINEMYPDGPDTTLIPIDTWWYQFKDRILEGLWTKPQAPLVNGLLTWDHCGEHTNINKDIFLYKKEPLSFKINSIVETILEKSLSFAFRSTAVIVYSKLYSNSYEIKISEFSVFDSYSQFELFSKILE